MAIKGVAASREDWREYVAVCSRIIDAASSGHDRRVLCSTLAHRADARARLGDAACWLADCDAALAAEPAHPGALLSKGALLSGLGRYAAADEARELAEQCRRLEAQARSGAVDLSEWVLAGFAGKFPDLAEYVGSVEAVAIGRGVIPDAADSDEKMFVWKDFVDKVLEAAEKCPKSAALIYTLSTGEERQDEFVVPDMAIFKNETEGDSLSDGTSAARAMGTQEAVHVDRILKVLDVNCLTEDAPAADVLGNNGVVNCGVGLWVLPSFINHSCHPNARRTHIGDHAIVHASRDIKAGEEITFPYFDVLVPVSKRREASRAWGFECKCDRCRFEAEDSILRQEILKSENDLASGGDIGAVVVWLEEKTRKSMVKERQKAFLRASFWSTYSALYDSDKLMRKWATYGKLVKRHAMRDLFRLTLDATNKINI
ncbi:unnamed protein product [Miscanthus lutarioriparius]|uniref:SET domain-containing protein n=1 Tax=Miscanthus lutarioriparius TaxID=422564 RepID=A0A811MB10_9POAL|nr:unnamed protein product [Miscanthus lutarioriparius]